MRICATSMIIFSSFSRKSDDQLSPNFHRFSILYILMLGYTRWEKCLCNNQRCPLPLSKWSVRPLFRSLRLRPYVPHPFRFILSQTLVILIVRVNVHLLFVYTKTQPPLYAWQQTPGSVHSQFKPTSLPVRGYFDYYVSELNLQLNWKVTVWSPPPACVLFAQCLH